MAAPTPAMARQAVTRRMRVAGLAGGALSVRAWLLLAAGTAGGHGGLAGAWERAAGAATSVLTVAVLARLAVTSRPAARARRRGPAAGGAV